MEKKTTLFSIAILSATLSIAQNFTETYNFFDVATNTGLVDPTPVPEAAGVSFDKFSAVGTSANSNANGRFSFTAWPTGATSGNDMYSSLTGSLNASEYYEVTVAPKNGFMLDLSSITFSVQRSGTGIRTYVVRSSVDGFASNLPASVAPVNYKLSVQAGDVFFWSEDGTTTNQNGSTITLSAANFTGLSVPVTFRFYGYNSEGAAGTFSIDNVTFTGASNVTTAVTNTIIMAKATVYPNPTSNGAVIIDLENVSNNTIIAIYNTIGENVFEKELNAFTKSNIDLSDKADGCYFIILKNDRETSIQKLIISK